MKIDELDNRHIIAEEGKEFRRIADGNVYGKEIYLGYSYYINDTLQTPPHYDVPEDFEEVDIPEDRRLDDEKETF